EERLAGEAERRAQPGQRLGLDAEPPCGLFDRQLWTSRIDVLAEKRLDLSAGQRFGERLGRAAQGGMVADRHEPQQVELVEMPSAVGIEQPRFGQRTQLVVRRVDQRGELIERHGRAHQGGPLKTFSQLASSTGLTLWSTRRSPSNLGLRYDDGD